MARLATGMSCWADLDTCALPPPGNRIQKIIRAVSSEVDVGSREENASEFLARRNSI
jgi:hypothetical protein